MQNSDSYIRDLIRDLIKTDRAFFKEIIKEVLIENEVIAPREMPHRRESNHPKPQRI